jgi:dCMP deaminase
MYIYGLPVCSECAKGIIQVGVERVVAFSKETPERWMDAIKKTTDLFEEAGIEYETAIVQ